MHKTWSNPHWFYVVVHELMLHVELSIVTWVWGSVIRFQTANWCHLTYPVFNKSNVKQSQNSVVLDHFKLSKLSHNLIPGLSSGSLSLRPIDHLINITKMTRTPQNCKLKSNWFPSSCKHFYKFTWKKRSLFI